MHTLAIIGLPSNVGVIIVTWINRRFIPTFQVRMMSSIWLILMTSFVKTNIFIVNMAIADTISIFRLLMKVMKLIDLKHKKFVLGPKNTL